MTQVYTVTVEQDGCAFPCRADQFVLPAMISARCGPVFHGCCGGGCGVCKLQVVSGEFEAVKPMSSAHISPEERQGGMILACCIQPRSDLALRRVSDKS